MKLQNLSMTVFLALSFFLLPFIDAIEKERLQTFFKEYGLREEGERQWERLPYAIEKGHLDVAEFLILNGDPLRTYCERGTNTV